MKKETPVRGSQFAVLDLRARAAAAFAALTDEQATKRNAKFKRLLKDRLDIDADPTGPEIEIDGIWFYLQGERLQVWHVCPKCNADIPGNHVASLADLHKELARPLLRHNCPPAAPGAERVNVPSDGIVTDSAPESAPAKES